MVGWHHRLDGLEFEQTPGAGDGQGGLACCCSWGHKGSDTAEQPNNYNKTGSPTVLPFLLSSVCVSLFFYFGIYNV